MRTLTQGLSKNVLQLNFLAASLFTLFEGPSTLATLFSHRWPCFCGGEKPLFSSFGEHTAACGSNVRQAVAHPRHRQSVFVAACHFLIIIFYVAATCRPSVLGSATKTRPPVAKQSGHVCSGPESKFCVPYMRYMETRLVSDIGTVLKFSYFL